MNELAQALDRHIARAARLGTEKSPPPAQATVADVSAALFQIRAKKDAEDRAKREAEAVRKAMLSLPSPAGTTERAKALAAARAQPPMTVPKNAPALSPSPAIAPAKPAEDRETRQRRQAHAAIFEAARERTPGDTELAQMLAPAAAVANSTIEIVSAGGLRPSLLASYAGAHPEISIRHSPEP